MSKRLAIWRGSACLLIFWPFVTAAYFGRHMGPPMPMLLATIVVYAAITAATGTKRILIGTLCGALLAGFLIPPVNGSAEGDVTTFGITTIAGTILGFFWRPRDRNVASTPEEST